MALGEAARHAAAPDCARAALESVSKYCGAEGESLLRYTTNAYLKKIMETMLT